ncbi:MAG: site-specific integrase, partial [Angelakisella sp.]
NCAVKQRVLNYNVVDYVEAPRRCNFKPTTLPNDGITRLLEACSDSEVYIPVLLAVTLGLRRGEALGLKWSDIDFQNHTLEIQRTATFYRSEFCLSDTKTKNSNRTLLLASSIVDKLLQQREKQRLQALEFGEGYNPYNLVSCRVDGTPLTSSVLNNEFRKAIDESGLPQMRFHDLRHTNATLMLRQNIPAKIVSSMLGHSSIGITLDTYSHVLTDMQEPAVSVIENLLQK